MVYTKKNKTTNELMITLQKRNRSFINRVHEDEELSREQKSLLTMRAIKEWS